MPFAAAIAAHSGRFSIVISGWSVMMATDSPVSESFLYVAKLLLLSSGLLLSQRVGPSITGISSFFRISATVLPSVQCSTVTHRSNSFFILMALHISSALCA